MFDNRIVDAAKGAIEGYVKDVLKNGSIDRFRFDSDDYRVSLDLKEYIKGTGVDNDKLRRELINEIEKGIAAKTGITPRIYLLGRHHIVIRLSHKVEAVNDFIARNGLEEEGLIIAGNEAGSRQNDRELLKAFPAAVKVNVGKTSYSLSKRAEGRVYQIGISGNSKMADMEKLLNCVVLNRINLTKLDGYDVAKPAGRDTEEGRELEHEIAAAIGKELDIVGVLPKFEKGVIEIKVRGMPEPLKLTVVSRGKPAQEVLQSLVESAPEQYRGFIEAVIKQLPDDLTVAVYDKLHKDLFGFADPANRLIALHKDVADNPIALFHEILEYVSRERGETLAQAFGMLDDRSREWFDAHLRKYSEEGKRGFFLLRRGHYINRAFARQVYGGRDAALTRLIKEKAVLAYDPVVEGIRKKYPWPRIGVIGAVLPSGPYLSSIGEKVGKKLWEYAGAGGYVFTGGVGGVGLDVYRGVARAAGGEDERFFVLLPEEMDASPGYTELSRSGSVAVAHYGEDMYERRIGMGKVADVVVALNGGPGTLHEAACALAEGKKVIALDHGGAGGALYQAKKTGIISAELTAAGITQRHLEQIVLGNADTVDADVEGALGRLTAPPAQSETEKLGEKVEADSLFGDSL